jgi:hypothetical protein
MLHASILSMAITGIAPVSAFGSASRPAHAEATPMKTPAPENARHPGLRWQLQFDTVAAPGRAVAGSREDRATVRAVLAARLASVGARLVPLEGDDNGTLLVQIPDPGEQMRVNAERIAALGATLTRGHVSDDRLRELAKLPDEERKGMVFASVSEARQEAALKAVEAIRAHDTLRSSGATSATREAIDAAAGDEREAVDALRAQSIAPVLLAALLDADGRRGRPQAGTPGDSADSAGFWSRVPKFAQPEDQRQLPGARDLLVARLAVERPTLSESLWSISEVARWIDDQAAASPMPASVRELMAVRSWQIGVLDSAEPRRQDVSDDVAGRDAGPDAPQGGRGLPAELRRWLPMAHALGPTSVGSTWPVVARRGGVAETDEPGWVVAVDTSARLADGKAATLSPDNAKFLSARVEPAAGTTPGGPAMVLVLRAEGATLSRLRELATRPPTAPPLFAALDGRAVILEPMPLSMPSEAGLPAGGDEVAFVVRLSPRRAHRLAAVLSAGALPEGLTLKLRQEMMFGR